MNFGAVSHQRAYCSSYDGASWTQWSAGGTSAASYMSGHGYIATKFNIEDSRSADGRSYWYSNYGDYTVPRGDIRTLNLRISAVWTGNLDTGAAGHNCSVNLYLLDRDPRGLTITQIRDAAMAQRSFSMSMSTYAGGVYADERRDITFGDLSLPTREDFYFVIQHSGVGYEFPYEAPEIRSGMINSRPLGMELGQSAAAVGESMSIRFENRLDDTVSVRFRYGGRTLHSIDTASDTIQVACERAWFDTAGLTTENEMRVTVTAEAGGDTAEDSFTLRVYTLNMTAGDEIAVGERFTAEVGGMTVGDSMTLVLHSGNAELHWERLDGNTCSVACPIRWFTDAGARANAPLTVTAVFTDVAQRSVSGTFTLRAIPLTIIGNKSSVTTGRGNESVIQFTVGNRAAEGHGNGDLQFTLRSGGAELESRSLPRDSVSATCVKAWFEDAGVRSSKNLPVTATVEDEYGRSAQYAFTALAGEDMEPALEQPEASIVQASAAYAFPDVYIAGYSRARITARVTAQTSAEITTAVVSYNGTLVDMTLRDDGVFETTTPDALTGDTVFTVTVLDGRGFRKTASVAVENVHRYTPPSFRINALYRCNESGEQSAGGIYYRINATAVCDVDLPGNSIVRFTSGVNGGENTDIASDTDYILPTGALDGKRTTVTVAIKDLLSEEISASWALTGGVNLIHAYNALVDKYYAFNSNLHKIPEKIVGFPALMQAYFDTIDMELFLKSGLMPTVSVSSTTAAREAAKLTASAVSPVAVGNLKACSASTAASAVLGAAKCLVRASYKVTVKSSSYDQTTHRWAGSFVVTNYSDEEDTADSAQITVTVNDDMEKYIRQKIATALTRESDDATDITELFKLSEDRFKTELGKYALQRLTAFRDACQACLDIMVQSGACNTSENTNLIRFQTQSGGGSGSGGGGGGTSAASVINRVMFDDVRYTEYSVGSGKWDAGATYTVRNDGTIVFNGTASVSPGGYACIFQLVSRYQLNGLSAGTHVFSLNTTDPGLYVCASQEVRDTGNGNLHFVSDDILKDTCAEGPLRVTVNEPGIPAGGSNYVTTGNVIFEIWMREGETLHECEVKPMFESGATAHEFTSPHTYSEWLSGNIGSVSAAQEAQGQTESGDKGYIAGKTSTVNGVTVMVNADGSVTLNGTASSAFQFYFADQSDGMTLPRGHYMYSLNTAASGVGAIFGERRKTFDDDGMCSYSVQHCVYQTDDYMDGPFRVIVEGAGTIRDDGSEFTGEVAIGFSVAAGVSFTSFVIRPQLESGAFLNEWVSPAAAAAGQSNLSQNDMLYNNLYKPYATYLSLIDAEIAVREHEIAIVTGTYGSGGKLLAEGVQTILLAERDAIQEALDFERFLGDELWEEFASYRREDSLSNQNFISNGLNNADLFKAAQEYIQAAEREIRKSAESQHSIKGELHNMLTMREFQPLTKSMCVGNWIRAGVDGRVYRLRLYSYEIDYDSMSFDVEFTNLQRSGGSASDVSDLLGRVRTISSSYGAVARQTKSGRQTKEKLDEWAENGIPLASKIAGVSGNEEFTLDQGGFSSKEYAGDTGMYEPTQVKFTSGGVYATTDAWKTGKTVVGRYSFTDPETGQTVEGYGSIAELLLGHMLLSGSSMIVNEDGSVLITKDGVLTKRLTVNGNAYVSGNLSVSGAKNRVAKTKDYGDRLLYGYETASPMFGDMGEGTIGDDGMCMVSLDPVFTQTISPEGYQVFLQCYGDGGCYVSERGGEFFIVRGTPGLRFGWELKARQAGYESARLETLT